VHTDNVSQNDETIKGDYIDPQFEDKKTNNSGEDDIPEVVMESSQRSTHVHSYDGWVF
jgi:hypothetical protein